MGTVPEGGTTVQITSIPIDSATAIITNPNINSLVVDCPHSVAASSVDNIKCNVLRITVIKGYGNKNGDDYTSSVTVTAGIAQQLLNVGGYDEKINIRLSRMSF